ncbi:LuxR C-terminal-related transcriptional regulator [Phaeobacter inhibens]|uniref:LuxR C-terminal-related transcriptional regulator n=1 Tax=Phaeobacter inhibens TaxID=221822 RepID=UPI000C9CE412|nr:response regulator transcription factor [Phaeobacter inhibens]AUQ63180.1 putative transcriptional regulator, containing response regulator domain [Phaeobacter inhibens]AUQ83084.1 putative transcriptional regulator, containing response regulator domain [Phaeobacter inhibens]AUQ90845.1 putative transcriptional regulator, containing response regulator domain [Phaeobacter inhibens]MDO6757622.1 response regulator transcription factor [Phaeobacter inhibens]
MTQSPPTSPPTQSGNAEPAKSARFVTALIVEDHPLFCDALAMTLRATVGISTIATAPTLEQAIAEIADTATPDAVVLDLNLPDVHGLDGLIRLRNATSAPILVVSSMADNRVISAAIHAGAAGFVPKHSQREIYISAFDAIARGTPFVPPGYVLLPRDSETQDATGRLATLTNQQARILQLICAGKLNKQIAYDLSIAETTVKAHVTAIMRKLGVQSRTQAVLIAKETSFANVLKDLG